MATDHQVQHYEEQARQAKALSRRLHRIPDLSKLAAQWQGERRCALRLLRARRDVAQAQNDFDAADAYLFAAIDVEATLRDRAAAAICEGTHMRYAHEVCA